MAVPALSIVLITCAPADARRAGEARGLPQISSYFGARSDPFRGGQAIHRGVDLPGPMGTAIVAAASGTIRFAGRRGGYGNLIEISHPDGSATRYGHLSRILVTAGQQVAQGETIAMMGSTGRSTGSHLHFEILVSGRAVDPLHYLADGGAVPRAIPARAWVAAPRKPVSVEPVGAFRSAFAQAREIGPRAAAAALPDGLTVATDACGASAPCGLLAK